MNSLNRVFTVCVVTIFIMTVLSGIGVAEQNRPGGSGSTIDKITPHKPGHRATPEKKLSKAPKWPWMVAGGLAVALVAILVGGGSGSSSSKDGGGTVEYTW